ncbi:MAG: HIT domain-containing protein [Actinocatenispora sp.]
MTTCRTCELVARRDAGDAPPWDLIVRTANWDIVHCAPTSMAGWLVLVTRRHVTAVADLTDDEARELGPMVRNVSRALHGAVGCAKTYVVQFAEHPDHPHVHVHVVPRADDLPAAERGPGVFAHLGVPADRQVPEERMNEIAAEVRRRLLDDGTDAV